MKWRNAYTSSERILQQSSRSCTMTLRAEIETLLKRLSQRRRRQQEAIKIAEEAKKKAATVKRDLSQVRHLKKLVA